MWFLWNLDSRIDVLLVARALIEPFRRCRIASSLNIHTLGWIGDPPYRCFVLIRLTRRLRFVHYCAPMNPRDGPPMNIRAMPVIEVCGPLTFREKRDLPP